MKNVPLDAIPDLSETQVIIYSRWDRSPDILEDQVTYPIVTAMLGAPGVRTVRGFSDFGYSFVYVIFDEGTDIYWARSRTQEYLSAVLPRLPQGVQTELGPDATGLGWVFQYVLVDTTGQQSLAELRSYQDWYLRYYLKSVPGVAEVAPIGGFRQQYQVNLDPNRLQFYNIPVSRVVEAIRGNNNDAGGRLIEFGGTEYMVRGRGYARSVQDFGNIALAVSDSGSPIRVRDVGEVVLGPDYRRGIADLNGEGDVVSGIVVMRQGQNALEVIERVKKKIREIEPGLPAGVKIVPVYDRSELINRAIDNLKWTIIEVMITVSLVVLLFLWHFPSAVIPIITIPLAVLISFIPFRLMGVTANIMSLAGIAIAIGALVDSAIVVVEQTHKKLELWEQEGRKGDYREVIIEAVKEVGGASFFALLVIAVSFLPVLTLEAQEGRLFKPLAYTKTLSMVVAAFLAITLDPALQAPVHPPPQLPLPAALALPGGERRPGGNHPLRAAPPRQPLSDPHLRTGGGLVAALEVDGHRRRRHPGPGDGARVPEARLRVHAPPGRRVALLHAHHHAGDLRHRGAEAPPGHRPDHQGIPGGRPGAREGGTGRDIDGPGALLDAGDPGHPQAEKPVAQSRHLVLLLGAGVAQARLPPDLARHPLARRNWSAR